MSTEDFPAESAWFKSSYSGSQGGDCLEVAYTWRKSSYSGSEGGACVEVATCPHAINVRDSKVSDGPTLTLAASTWDAFIDSTRGSDR